MFSINEIATTSRVDSGGNLTLFSAVQMMQDCSELWFESQPMLQQHLAEHGRAQFLAARQVKVLRIPRYGERLVVSSGVYECRSMYCYRNTLIQDAQGEVCYACWCMGAFVDLKSGRLCPIPADVVASVSLCQPCNMGVIDRHILIPKAEIDITASYHVVHSDIDYNCHMNNSHYLRIVLAQLPVSFNPSSLRVEYKMPMHEDDDIEIAIRKVDSGYVAELSARGGVAAVIELK